MSSYYASIDACVPQTIASLQSFQNAWVIPKKTCSGGTISTTSQLNGLAFCQIIDGDLIISVSDQTADFTTLHDIQSITGLPKASYALIFEINCPEGALVVSGSSMSTLSHFASIASISGSIRLEGSAHGLVATGLERIIQSRRRS